jgi:hypothetical protein
MVGKSLPRAGTGQVFAFVHRLEAQPTKRMDGFLAEQGVFPAQMRWTPLGAHRLLQARLRMVNQQLRGDFGRWHSRLQSAPEPVRLAA